MDKNQSKESVICVHHGEVAAFIDHMAYDRKGDGDDDMDELDGHDRDESRFYRIPLADWQGRSEKNVLVLPAGQEDEAEGNENIGKGDEIRIARHKKEHAQYRKKIDHQMHRKFQFLIDQVSHSCSLSLSK
jgi:hypothetical protein